jgi:apolipoprotein N-acyltransferase
MHFIPLALVIVGSALGAGALAIPSFWFLAPLALGLFFYALWHRTPFYPHALLYGFVFGFVTGGAGVFWFWDAFPLDWMGIQNESMQWMVLATTWLVVSLSLALGPALAAVAIWATRSNSMAAIIAALCWMLAEEGRMWGYALLTWGAESLFGSHFSIAAMGYVLAENHYLLQIASLGGIAALNATVALLGAGIAAIAYAILTKRLDRRVVIGTAAMGIALLLPLPLGPEEAPVREPLQAALIGTSFPLTGATEVEGRLRSLLAQAASSSPDIIVMPEGFGVRKAFPEAGREDVLAGLFGPEALILSADYVHEGDATRMRLSYGHTAEGELTRYDKLFFIPLGEYSPYLAAPLYAPFRDRGVESHLGKVRNRLARGDGVTATAFKGRVIGALLCSDSLSPHLYRAQAARYGANVLVNLSNEAWFHGTPLVHERLVQIGKVHAVANRAYYLQASNLAPSFAISPNGALIAESTGAESVLVVELP